MIRALLLGALTMPYARFAVAAEPVDVAPSAQAPSCAATRPWRPALANAPTDGAPSPSCFVLRLDVAGRGVVQTPAVGVSRRTELSRSQADLALHSGPASARIAMVLTRSGAPTGYLGINGEALVPEVQNAEARVDLRRYGLAAAIGVVDDLWLVSTQEAWELRLAGMTLAEDRRWIARSDAGAWASWTSPADLVSVAASLTTGEGANYRERNDGKDLTGLLIFRPLALADAPPETLEIALFGREGSRGQLVARNHRAGARVSTRHAYFGAGFEAVAGWGLDVDAALEPRGWSAWLRTGPALPAIGWARLDVGTDDRNTADSRLTTLRLGGGPMLPLNGDAIRPIYAAAIYERGVAEAQARPVAGAEAGQRWQVIGITLGVRLDAGIEAVALRGVMAPP